MTELMISTPRKLATWSGHRSSNTVASFFYAPAVQRRRRILNHREP